MKISYYSTNSTKGMFDNEMFLLTAFQFCKNHQLILYVYYTRKQVCCYAADKDDDAFKARKSEFKWMTRRFHEKMRDRLCPCCFS